MEGSVIEYKDVCFPIELGSHIFSWNLIFAVTPTSGIEAITTGLILQH